MNIGIIGYGVVGKAIGFSFTKIGYNVKVHDIKLDTAMEDVLETDIVYVCVPTSSLSSGACDVSIVDETVGLLNKKQYEGVIAIKSTVVPGTTDKLRHKYGLQKTCFVPEFLRERCAIADFTENHDVCIVGTYSDEVFEIVKKSHNKYPQTVIKCTPTEAELCKYFNNLYNATLIMFANSFYEVCKLYNADYSVVKSACTQRQHIVDAYLDCNENFRAFGGPCLPKDLKAIVYALQQSNSHVDLFECIFKENQKYKVSVFEGMRE